LPLDISTVASRHDELLRQVVRGSLARLLSQLAAVRTILLDSFREQGADASGTRLLFSANVLFTLTCALIFERRRYDLGRARGGPVRHWLFSWCMPMFGKTISWIAE
jgi:hypothetical protein